MFVLCSCAHEQSIGGTDPTVRLLLGVFESLLDHLSDVFDPLSLLEMLPDRGDVRFFLPFVERSVARSKARRLIRIIEEDARDRYKNNNS